MPLSFLVEVKDSDIVSPVTDHPADSNNNALDDQDEDDEYSSSDSAEDFEEGGGYSNDNQLHAEASSSKLSAAGSAIISDGFTLLYQTFINWWPIKMLRVYLALPKIRILTCFGVFLTSVGFLLYGAHSIPDNVLSDIQYYNVVHVALNFICHALVMSLYELHVEIWKLTLARSLTTHGATIKMLRTHALRDSSAIGLFRKTSVLLSLFLGLAVTVLSFNFHWYPVPTKILTDICNPVTYPEILKSDLVGLSSLMEGTASFARLDSYGIPLADGLIIGISSWPLVAPKEIFSAETQGYAGAVRVVCGQEEGAKERMNETTITSGKVERVDNHMHGIMDIYYPPDTFVKLGPGYELGLTQKCTWDIKIGQATVDGAFGADDWNMVAIGRLSGVRAGDFKISSPADDHKGEHPLFTYDQVASHLQGDTVGLALAIDIAFADYFSNRTFTPFRPAVYPDILQFGTDDSRLFNPDNTFKGLSFAILTLLHLVMNLYDGGTVSECNYYAQAGGGIIDVAKEYILIVLVFGYTILSTTLLFVAYTLLRQKDSEMVDAAFHTLHSNFGTALDMCANGDSIFQESSSTFLNFNDSITKLHGATRIFYGYLLDSERYGSVGYGLQHQIEFKQKE